jgi:hypothetical protein
MRILLPAKPPLSIKRCPGCSKDKGTEGENLNWYVLTTERIRLVYNINPCLRSTECAMSDRWSQRALEVTELSHTTPPEDSTKASEDEDMASYRTVETVAPLDGEGLYYYCCCCRDGPHNAVYNSACSSCGHGWCSSCSRCVGHYA